MAVTSIRQERSKSLWNDMLPTPQTNPKWLLSAKHKKKEGVFGKGCFPTPQQPLKGCYQHQQKARERYTSVFGMGCCSLVKSTVDGSCKPSASRNIASERGNLGRFDENHKCLIFVVCFRFSIIALERLTSKYCVCQ